MEWESLPEGCIATLLARTTPLDTCRLSLVSKTFYSAAQSDAIWTTFLPDNYSSIISRSNSGASLLANSPSLKSLYLALSDHPILIDNDTKSLQLERKSGKKCYMLAARALHIAFGDTPNKYLNWKSLTESRFPEVAELLDVCRLEIRGVICSNALSPNTRYATYLVFKMIRAGCGFLYYPGELSVDLSSVKQFAGWQSPNVMRSDGWLEIMIGEFFNSGLDGEEVQISFLETKGGHWKHGLIIEGIEVRPMEEN